VLGDSDSNLSALESLQRLLERGEFLQCLESRFRSLDGLFGLEYKGDLHDLHRFARHSRDAALRWEKMMSEKQEITLNKTVVIGSVRKETFLGRMSFVLQLETRFTSNHV